MSLSYIWKRLKGVWKERGTAGFLKFLATRVIRVDKDLVFERILHADSSASAAPAVGTLTDIDKSTIDTPCAQALIDRVLTDEDRHYAEGLRRDDRMFVVTGDDGTVLHHSLVQFDTKYKTVLQEERDTPLFTHCWTSPKARGKHLYPTILRHGCTVLGNTGFDRAVITCHPGNTASVKGIERAEFRHQRQLTNIIFLSRLVLQKVKDQNTPVRWRLLIL